MSAQTTEQKKEEFRKYLERAGVIDQLTKVLVGLYEDPDKGGNAIEKIKQDKSILGNLSGASNQNKMQALVTELTLQLTEKVEEITALQSINK